MVEILSFEKDRRSSIKGPVTAVGKRLLSSLSGDGPMLSFHSRPSTEDQAFVLNTAMEDRILTFQLYQDLIERLSQSAPSGEDSPDNQ
jgi:hypothetical protein